MQGYIKLHRKIRESPIFNDPQLLRLWMICLTEATHKERDQIIGRSTVHLMPGDFVTGRYDIMEMYNRGLAPKDKVKGEKTVFRWLESLEKGGFLTIKKTNKYSVVSIDNWGFYQGNDQQNDEELTNKRPSNDHQMTTNKNVKNVENDNKKDSSRKRVYDEESIHYQLAVYFYQQILKNNENHKKPNMQNWANDIRLMMERDDRTEEQIRFLMKWVQEDSFEMSNVQSPSKLRERFDNLVMKVKRDRSKQQGNVVPMKKVEYKSNSASSESLFDVAIREE